MDGDEEEGLGTFSGPITAIGALLSLPLSEAKGDAPTLLYL